MVGLTDASDEAGESSDSDDGAPSSGQITGILKEMSDTITKGLDEKTKAVYCESLCNPGGVVTDIAKVAEIAHAAGLPQIGRAHV